MRSLYMQLLCDSQPAGSVQCYWAGACAGAVSDSCFPADTWSSGFISGEDYYDAWLWAGGYDYGSRAHTHAFSVPVSWVWIIALQGEECCSICSLWFRRLDTTLYHGIKDFSAQPIISCAQLWGFKVLHYWVLRLNRLCRRRYALYRGPFTCIPGAYFAVYPGFTGRIIIVHKPNRTKDPDFFCAIYALRIRGDGCAGASGSGFCGPYHFWSGTASSGGYMAFWLNSSTVGSGARGPIEAYSVRCCRMDLVSIHRAEV